MGVRLAANLESIGEIEDSAYPIAGILRILVQGKPNEAEAFSIELNYKKYGIEKQWWQKVVDFQFILKPRILTIQLRINCS